MEPTRSPEATGPGLHSARRRLIRGAFSAPAALTLYSGSSFAATSLTCVARQVASPVDPTTRTTSATADIYLRVQLRSKGSGNARTTWVWGSDLLVAASLTIGQSSNSFLGTDNWYCLQAGSASGFTSGLVYLPAAATAGGTPALVNAFVAIRVDATGKIVGVTSAANASAVSRSCWTSFVRTL